MATVAMPSAAVAVPVTTQSSPAPTDQDMKQAEASEAVASRVTVRTPQIHWHGKSPVFAVDFHPTFHRLCATGGSEPDGSGGVHLWLMNEGETAEQSPVDFVQDLQGHEKTVNCLRFSPNGELLASAGVEGAVVIWRRATAATSAANAKAGGERWEYMSMLRAHVLDVCDLSWSPSSQQIVTACVDNTAAVFSVFGKEKVSAHIRGHDHFVLGVAWDPAEEYILTISSDRTCRLHTSAGRKWKADCRVSHVARSMEFPEKGCGPTVLQMVPQNHVLSPEEAANKKARDFKLFLDDSLCAHRRRPAWSPDGIFAVVPGGVHQASSSSPQTFVTHLISRRNPTKPFAFLPAGKQPTVAVRFCPVGFKLRAREGESVDPGSLPTPEKLSVPRKNQTIDSPFNMAYRMLFAVASLDSVAVYDTQQMGKPLLHVRGIHFTPLTDLSWSNDGRLLVATSSDGYCTIIEFAPGELGEAMEIPLATVARSKKDEAPGGATEEAEASTKAAAPAPAPAQPSAPVSDKTGDKAEADATAPKVAEESASKKRRIIPKVVNSASGPGGEGSAASASAPSTAAPTATDLTREEDSAGSSGEPIVLEDSQDKVEAVNSGAQDEAMKVEEGPSAGGPAGEGVEGVQSASDKAASDSGAGASEVPAAPHTDVDTPAMPADDADKQAPKKRRIVPSVITPAAPPS